MVFIVLDMRKCECVRERKHTNICMYMLMVFRRCLMANKQERGPKVDMRARLTITREYHMQIED